VPAARPGFRRVIAGPGRRWQAAFEPAVDHIAQGFRRLGQGRRSEVILHSDQGAQFGPDGFVRFCKGHQLKPGMSCRGNCYDNAVAESFFSNLKKERHLKRLIPEGHNCLE
jgi:putative transposase